MAVPIVAAIWIGGTSKESQKTPYVRSPERQQICHQRGSNRRPDRATAGVASRVVIAPVPTSGGRRLFPEKETGPSRLAGGRGLSSTTTSTLRPGPGGVHRKFEPSRYTFW